MRVSARRRARRQGACMRRGLRERAAPAEAFEQREPDCSGSSGARDERGQRRAPARGLGGRLRAGIHRYDVLLRLLLRLGLRVAAGRRQEQRPPPAAAGPAGRRWPRSCEPTGGAAMVHARQRSGGPARAQHGAKAGQTGGGMICESCAARLGSSRVAGDPTCMQVCARRACGLLLRPVHRCERQASGARGGASVVLVWLPWRGTQELVTRLALPTPPSYAPINQTRPRHRRGGASPPAPRPSPRARARTAGAQCAP